MKINDRKVTGFDRKQTVFDTKCTENNRFFQFCLCGLGKMGNFEGAFLGLSAGDFGG